MLHYEGIFFEKETEELIHSLESNQLAMVNDILHCTFKYQPSKDEIFNDIVGREFEIYLIAYGNDGRNSGFEVSLPEELNKYYINYDEYNVLKKPHITATMAEEAKAINTKDLSFIPLEKPVKIVGKFGYWIKEDNREYVSYEPYNK